MLWTEQLFHIKKPIIAMLHPDALKMLYFFQFYQFYQYGVRQESGHTPSVRDCPLHDL